MNFSSTNVTVVHNRDSFNKAVTKNVIVVVLGISINYINATLVHTFNKHQVYPHGFSLEPASEAVIFEKLNCSKIFKMNPRYILFIHLVVNDMIQLTITVTLFLLSYTLYTINVSFCAVFVLLAIFTTVNTPLNLACMAVECFIAICVPLRHAQVCTVKRTYILIGLIWATSMISTLPDLFVALATEPLEYFHSRIFCRRETVFRNPHVHKKTDVYYGIFLILIWLTVFYAYLRILFTARAADSDAKKARKTILLHGFQLLLCMLTYVAPLIKQGLLQLFPKHFSDTLFASYVIIQVMPRFISPIVYGLRDQTFRRYLKKSLLSNEHKHLSYGGRH